VMGT
jgi:hypothetical protein